MAPDLFWQALTERRGCCLLRHRAAPAHRETAVARELVHIPHILGLRFILVLPIAAFLLQDETSLAYPTGNFQHLLLPPVSRASPPKLQCREGWKSLEAMIIDPAAAAFSMASTILLFTRPAIFLRFIPAKNLRIPGKPLSSWVKNLWSTGKPLSCLGGARAKLEKPHW